MLRLRGLSDLCRYKASRQIETSSTHRPTSLPQVLPRCPPWTQTKSKWTQVSSSTQLQVKARLSQVHLLSWSRTNKRQVRTTTIFGCMKITYCYCYWCY
ncbi:hypothetical protein Y032_0001g240 [Ancylostoma ceylanicum]|uniref:Uncharacterized protein n=1 Tax=Ancylostoma ceylanicum TaxID=53326 RepID=A0A016W543_9BILA|nr:hypothetical protein Y032_0001g240 [Ancylostoma ceylanicum]